MFLAFVTNPTATADKRLVNLVKNPGFELGKKRPANWGEPDDLTLFWVYKKSGKKVVPPVKKNKDKCIKIDTDVYANEVYARWKEMKKPPSKRKPAKPKTKTKGKKYNTIGGCDGVHLYSDAIPVKKDVTYKLSVDVKSGKTAFKLFIKGFAKIKCKNNKYRMRIIYKCYKHCKGTKGKWKTFSRTFTPASKRTPNVTEIKVMLFAYWPPGEVFVDNISVTEFQKK